MRAMRGDSLLRSLRIILHVSFAALLFVALLRTATGAAGVSHQGMSIALGILLGLLYLVGTVVEKRHTDRGRALPRGAALTWLLAVTILWLSLLGGNLEFSWLAFPLFFVHFAVLPVRWASLTVLLTTGAVGAAQWWHADNPQIAVIIGPLFGAAFAGAMTWIYKSLYADLTHQRELVTQLQETRADLARSQHEAGVIAERERMAREIHDTLAQGLSSIVLISRAARKALDSGDTGLVGERLAVVESAASDNLAEARRFVRAVSEADPNESNESNEPNELSPTLSVILAGLCAVAQKQMNAVGANAQVSFVGVDEPDPVDPSAVSELVRVAQTLLGNVVAHSKAQTCVATLTSFPQELTLDVYDNGIGFDPAALADGRADGTGYGLRGASRRMAELGGTIEVGSTLGEGTLVTVRVPVAAATEQAPPQNKSKDVADDNKL